MFLDPAQNIGFKPGDRFAVIDIDTKHGGKGAESWAAVCERLGPFPETAEAVTASGGGLLIYRMPAGAGLEFQKKMLGMPDLEFRVGAVNCILPPSRVQYPDGKLGQHQWKDGRAPGEIEFAELPAVVIEALRAYGPEKAQAKTRTATKVKGSGGTASALLTDRAKKAAIAKAKPDNLASVLAGCAWMEHCEADAANLSEPEWHAMLGIAGRCEDGRELSHKLSEPYAGYSYEETEDKIDHALNDAGPVGCTKVAGEFGFEGCVRCPARGITSPMNFADQPPALVRELAQYVYVIELRRYFNVATGKLLTPEMFADSAQARVGAQAHSKAMSSRTTGKVDALDFRPGDPRLIIRNEDGSSVVNTWRRGGIQPAAGDPKPILDFFERFIVDARSREHVTQYLAHLVRYPSVKIEHAIIITGGYGTGKGTLRDILISMFGPCNVQKIEGDELTDRNNSKWVNCQTLFFEETEQGDKLEVYRRLKELITGDTYRVQDKYIPTYEGRSPRGIFMVSNESTPMLIKTNDRRYFMCDTPESPATDEEVKANGQFFAELRRVLGRDDNAVAAFMHHLMTAVDLSSFPVKGRPPMTAAKKRAVQESRTPAAAVLADLVEAGVAPFNRDLVTAKQAMDAIEAAGWGRTLERMSMKKMADVLRSVGGFQVNIVDGDHKQVRITRDLAPRLWGIRNKAKWGDAPATDLRTEWLGGKPAAEADVVQLHATGLDRVIAKAV